MTRSNPAALQLGLDRLPRMVKRLKLRLCPWCKGAGVFPPTMMEGFEGNMPRDETACGACGQTGLLTTNKPASIAIQRDVLAASKSGNAETGSAFPSRDDPPPKPFA